MNYPCGMVVIRTSNATLYSKRLGHQVGPWSMSTQAYTYTELAASVGRRSRILIHEERRFAADRSQSGLSLRQVVGTRRLRQPVAHGERHLGSEIELGFHRTPLIRTIPGVRKYRRVAVSTSIGTLYRQWLVLPPKPTSHDANPSLLPASSWISIGKKASKP